ncbi:Uncharacterized protein dnm_086170 [Desulfonema magnum]|uniref:Uncharacterized protein n=1 Tax=Desulfonema magnum TaxID=45655 RepID=A0A975GSY9_9BACT|nr:Uncharacterized protein dnm_086170 [Desulfonema magnum]
MFILFSTVTTNSPYTAKRLPVSNTLRLLLIISMSNTRQTGTALYVLF